VPNTIGFNRLAASLNSSRGSYVSRSRKRFTLSCEILIITSDKRVQVVDFGSLIKNPMCIGKVHLPVGGRVVCLIKIQHAVHTSQKLAMRKS